jgi:protein transport protein SEC20
MPGACRILSDDTKLHLQDMPPIPITLDAEAFSLIESIERHYNDLSTFQIPRLKACTGPLSTQQAWASEVREDIEGLAKQIEVCWFAH